MVKTKLKKKDPIRLIKTFIIYKFYDILHNVIVHPLIPFFPEKWTDIWHFKSFMPYAKWEHSLKIERSFWEYK